MTEFDFYKLTKDTIIRTAGARGISSSELKKYYSHTDKYCHFYNDISGIPQVFAQMAFHMQNATMISSIVKFESNYDFLKRVTCNFVPNDFISKYSSCKDRVDCLVEDLRWNASTGQGLKWDSSKSTKKDAIAIRFAKSLFECAEYLKSFATKQDVLNDLKSHYNNNVKSLISYFKSKIKTGFSVALSCDFLKEFDSSFDLPKPDVHIKDVISALYGREENYYNTTAKEYELIQEMQELTKNINDVLNSKGEDPITVYQLDRMIWLACTENFFIHFPSTLTSKQIYISNII